jgi:hypothetical protein
MSYHEWFQQHGAKHARILRKLAHLSDEEVIAYFRYDNMVIHETDFCPLYAQNKRCHTMDNLNCYLCACPHFRFNDAGFEMRGDALIKSYCHIQAPGGESLEHDHVIHHNCSGCTLPHTDAYIRRHFSRDWFEIMKDVQSTFWYNADKEEVIP